MRRYQDINTIIIIVILILIIIINKMYFCIKYDLQIE
jgi:hypothetical protein